MARYKKNSGGMIEVFPSRSDQVNALSLGILSELGEVVTAIKDQQQRVAHLEGSKEPTPTLKIEKKIDNLKKLLVKSDPATAVENGE